MKRKHWYKIEKFDHRENQKTIEHNSIQITKSLLCSIIDRDAFINIPYSKRERTAPELR